MDIPFSGIAKDAVKILQAGRAAAATVRYVNSIRGAKLPPSAPPLSDAVSTAWERDRQLLTQPSSGTFSQQGNSLIGRFKRQVINWEIPQLDSLIKMYLNPTRVEIQSQKQIAEQRTKGGFIIQYWGEILDSMSFSGTTGSGGIEGILILRDIYRSEQQKIEMLKQNFRELLQAGQDQSNTSNDLEVLADQDLEMPLYPRSSRKERLTSSLAEQASSVIMHYQGASYRGYFTNMTVTETSDKLGLFDYTIQFKILATIGTRRNFMPWHRDPRFDITTAPLTWRGTARLTDVEMAAGEHMRIPFSTPFSDTSDKTKYMKLARDIYKKGLRGFGLAKFAKHIYDTYQEQGTLSASGEVLARTKYGQAVGPRFAQLIERL